MKSEVRLPKGAFTFERYDVSLQPFLDKQSFIGIVTMTVLMHYSREDLIFHMKDLNIQEVIIQEKSAKIEVT